MKAINRLLEVSLFNKYQKYIKSDLVPEIGKFLGTSFNIVPSSINPYGLYFRSTYRTEDKTIDIILQFTTNDDRIEKGDNIFVNLVVNGKSFPTSIKAKDVEEDIGELGYAFDCASRYFDVNLSLEDDHIEQE